MKDECTSVLTTERELAPLTEQVSSQLEALRRERIFAFVRETKRAAPTSPTPLESRVDALLESVTDLTRLNQLALLTSRGGQITVEADRLLAATHGDIFEQLVLRYSERNGGRIPAMNLLPSYPLPLE